MNDREAAVAKMVTPVAQAYGIGPNSSDFRDMRLAYDALEVERVDEFCTTHNMTKTAKLWEEKTCKYVPLYRHKATEPK